MIIKKAFIILSLISIFNQLKIDLILPMMVLPNIENKLTPFRISGEDKFERENRYYLKADCSSSVIENFSFNKKSEYLCSKKIEFEYDMVNNFLDEIKVRLNTRQQIHNLYIDYKLMYNDIKGKEIVINKRQEIKTVYEIPITQQIDKFEFVPGKEVNFNLFILEVDEEYYKFSNSFHYEIVFSMKNHPDWLAYDINQRKVHFFGKISKNQVQNFNFAFYVLDRETKLSSPLNTFWFSVVKPSVIVKKKNKYFILIFAILIFVFIFCFLIFFKIKDYRKYREEEKRIEEKNLEICKDIEKKSFLKAQFLKNKKNNKNKSCLETQNNLDSYELDFKIYDKNKNSFNTNANSFGDDQILGTKKKKFEFSDFHIFFKKKK